MGSSLLISILFLEDSYDKRQLYEHNILNKEERNESFPFVCLTATSDMLKTHILGCSFSTYKIREWDGGVSTSSEICPGKPFPVRTQGLRTQFDVLWGKLMWCVIMAFYIYPLKYFPGHHREGSTQSCEIIDLMEMTIEVGHKSLSKFVKIHQIVCLKFGNVIICKLYCNKADPPPK